MDDRPDMREYLDSLAPEERDEIRAFLARFEQQLDAKLQQLRHELQDPDRLSPKDLEMRTQLLACRVPLISDDGELIFRGRDELQIQDLQRFAAFMDADAARREAEIFGDPDSEN